MMAAGAKAVRHGRILRLIRGHRQPHRLDENKFRIFGARRADATGLGEREARVDELALPKSVESGKLSLEIW